MSKDWTGNKKTPFIQNSVSSHSKEIRQKEDFYATDPKAIEMLLKHEKFSDTIWECAAGDGALSNELLKHDYNVINSDIIDRGAPNTQIIDFLEYDGKGMDCDILTNPPYKYVSEFILKALKLSKRKVAMFCKIQLLESKKRYEAIFKENPPAKVYVFVKRIDCFKNNDTNKKSLAVCYAWFIWDKEYNGPTVVDWLY